MALINRLIGQGVDEAAGETKIAIGPAIAAFEEFQEGKCSWDDLVGHFELTGPEQLSLQEWMLGASLGLFTLTKLERILILGENGFYDLVRVKDILGIA